MTDPKKTNDKEDRYGQSGAQSGNAGMKQKSGADAGGSADANDREREQNGAEATPKTPDPARDEVE